MALSQQDLFVQTLLGNKGYYVDIGAGDGAGLPCASNTYWLEELGWTGILLEFDPQYSEQARKLRPNSHFVLANALTIDYKQLFRQCNTPQVIDYLSIDIEPSSVAALARFPFDEYDFKIMTIEHDFYNMPQGIVQKRELTMFMREHNYIRVVEDVGLSYMTTHFLEDWFINPKYLHEFRVPRADLLYYYRQNPNAIIADLTRRAK
jgi:hypothetical protein